MNKYECLKLKNQLCFPLYSASNKIIRSYKPLLKELNLTYTQYLVMMALWEKEPVIVKSLGECLFLGTGTLSPVIQRLEAKGYIERASIEEDERIVAILLTDAGKKLKEKAVSIPTKLGKEFKLESEEVEQLYKILYKILDE